MAREIVLDTETTGLDPRSGHRVIEIACIEVEDLLPTGAHFHRYIEPDRDIDPDAERVHGISRASLRGRPRFHEPEIAVEFLDFIGDARLVAHNAAFDRGFVNMELERAGFAPVPDARWTCTYQLAQKRFPSMHNSLDALCKRYKISLAEREKHGALIDTKLLALVYLELQGGKERALNFAPSTASGAAMGATHRPVYGQRLRPLAPLSTIAERERHAAWIGATFTVETLWAKVLEAESAAA